MTLSVQAAFARFLDAASPYLDEIVIVGGWASRLHRLSPRASPPSFEPLLSDDVDAALRTGIAPRESRLDDLLKRCGFEEVLSGEMTPPVTTYELAEPKGFEVEFLTDQPGGYSRRPVSAAGSASGLGGERKADLTAKIAGVTAQKLHYVGLLLREPWTVDVTAHDGYPVANGSTSVRVPNPASYVVQKLLARADRGDKRVKDLLYVHDTIEVFGDDDNAFEQPWLRLCAHMPRGWRDRCRAAARQVGKESNPDTIDCAKLAAHAGRPTTTKMTASVLRAGLRFLDLEP